MSHAPSSAMPGSIDRLILSIRDTKVILDSDLAALYGVETKVLNQAVKRNNKRFPSDFMFRLTAIEWKNLKSQNVTSSPHGGRRSLPNAFSEHGALMVANVLRSENAEKMSVHVVRAFIKQREFLVSQIKALGKLAELDSKLMKHDEALRLIWRELQPLLTPPPPSKKRRAGFHP
ncbi:MAG: ORF6N domain-containing protein [Oceanipulchritudo sp.]